MDRIFIEIEDIRKNRPYLIYAKLLDNSTVKISRSHFLKKNSNVIECGFPGPSGQQEYDGSFYTIYIVITDYPYKAPVVIFQKKQFHPNIYADGLVCLDLLGSGKWKPTLGIVDIISAIQELLASPNPRSPANQTAARIFNKGGGEYQRMVKENIKKFNSLKSYFQMAK